MPSSQNEMRELVESSSQMSSSRQGRSHDDRSGRHRDDDRHRPRHHDHSNGRHDPRSQHHDDDRRHRHHDDRQRHPDDRQRHRNDHHGQHHEDHYRQRHHDEPRQRHHDNHRQRSPEENYVWPRRLENDNKRQSPDRRPKGRYDTQDTLPQEFYSRRWNAVGGSRPSRERDISVASQEQVPKWSWKAMIVSVTSLTVFVSMLGLFGIVFAGLAYADHKVGDYKRSKFKLRLSWFFAILGICITVTLLILLFIAMYAVDIPKSSFKNHKYWVPPWLYGALEDN